MSDLDETSAKLVNAARARGDTPVHPAVGERIWSGVEAGVAAPPPRAWRRHQNLLGVATVAAVAAVVVLALPKDEEPRLVTGTAFMLEEGKWLRLREPVQLTSKVVAGDRGASFETAGARLFVGKGSVLVFLTRDQHAWDEGSALYEGTPRGPGYVLTMGEWRLSVAGKRFWVMRSPNENVIEVYDGVVRLQTGTREIELHSGDSFRERFGPATMATSPPPVDPPVAAVSPPSPNEPTLAEALSRVRKGKYKEAERMYRWIAEHTPAHAEVALYALAKMKLQKSGELEQGLLLLEAIERDYPKGALRQERMLTRIEALFRHARCEEAKAAVAAYVKEYVHAIDSLREIDASQCAP